MRSYPIMTKNTYLTYTTAQKYLIVRPMQTTFGLIPNVIVFFELTFIFIANIYFNE